MSNYYHNLFCNRCKCETKHVILDDVPRKGKTSVRCEKCKLLQTSEAYRKSHQLVRVEIAAHDLEHLAAAFGGVEFISEGEVS